MAEEKRKGCLKVGCLGCALLVGIPLLLFAVLLGLGMLTGGEGERIEPVSSTRDIPAYPLRGPEFPSGPPADWDAAADPARAGRIVLDVVNRGRFAIRPGPAGSPIRLEGHYDAGMFNLDESYETTEGAGWKYRLELDQKGVGIRPFVQQGSPKNDLVLILPRDLPMVLEGSIGIGESELELGGLWLAAVDLEVGIGSHELTFDEPSPVPMDRLRLDNSVGELRIDGLGNASPQTVQITRSIGSLRLDMTGQWRRDAEIDVSCGIGECYLHVPDDVGIDLRGGDILIGETNLGSVDDRQPSDPDAPVLSLSVAGTIGEIRIDD